MDEIEARHRGRPRNVTGNPDDRVIHVRVSEEIIRLLDAEWHRRGVQSRAEAHRAILREALRAK